MMNRLNTSALSNAMRGEPMTRLELLKTIAGFILMAACFAALLFAGYAFNL